VVVKGSSLVILHLVGTFAFSGNSNTLELRAPAFFSSKSSAQDIKKFLCKQF
jgi:hypothetical protein